MKKIITSIILMCFFFMLSFVVMAQDGPPDPGGDPGTGGDPIGGGAPIGGGTLILIGLGAAYAVKKVYTLYKDNQEELEA